MVLTYSQQVNPIRSQVWCPFREQHTELGTKVTNSYGSYSRYLQVGDGSTASTFPEMIGSKGFRFTGSQYLGFVGSSLTLGDSWSICMMIRPKLYISDGYLVGFSNGGGIVAKNSGESDELTYNDGATTISSGIELSKDRFYSIIITKDSSNNVTFYINGEEEGSGIGTNSGFDLDYIGCDGSLGSFYEGELREFCVFDFELAPIQASILDNRFIRVIEGQEFYWTPGDILGSLGAWFDFRSDSRGTYAAQPTTDLLAGSWTGIGATLSNVGSSLKVLGGGVSNPYALKSGVLTLGNRYALRGSARGDSVGGAPQYADDPYVLRWNGTSAASAQAMSAEWTASNTGIRLYGAQTNTAGLYALYEQLALANLSLTRFDPRAATGALAGSAIVQATPANMPWWDDGVWFDASDYVVSDAVASAWDSLHTNGTMCIRFYINSWRSVDGILDTQAGPVPSHAGLVVYSRPSGSSGDMRLYASNGAAYTVDIGTVNCLVLGWNTITFRISSSVYDVRVNGTSVHSGAPLATPGGVAYQTAVINRVAGSGGNHTYKHIVVSDRYLSNACVNRLEAYVS